MTMIAFFGNERSFFFHFSLSLCFVLSSLRSLSLLFHLPLSLSLTLFSPLSSLSLSLSLLSSVCFRSLSKKTNNKTTASPKSSRSSLPGRSSPRCFFRSTTAAAVLALFALAAALPAGSRWPAFLHSRVWDCWRRRFRYCGVVPSVPYTKPGEQYVFGHFPHTCFPMGSFLCFPLCGDAATGVPGPMQALVATVLLKVPFYKHVFAWLGCHPADKPVMLDL